MGQASRALETSENAGPCPRAEGAPRTISGREEPSHLAAEPCGGAATERMQGLQLATTSRPKGECPRTGPVPGAPLKARVHTRPSTCAHTFKNPPEISYQQHSKPASFCPQGPGALGEPWGEDRGTSSPADPCLP